MCGTDKNCSISIRSWQFFSNVSLRNPSYLFVFYNSFNTRVLIICAVVGSTQRKAGSLNANESDVCCWNPPLLKMCNKSKIILKPQPHSVLVLLVVHLIIWELDSVIEFECILFKCPKNEKLSQKMSFKTIVINKKLIYFSLYQKKIC